jgi:penicillin-binding protein 2
LKIAVIVLALLLMGCTPPTETAIQPLPTLVNTELPPEMSLDNAHRVAYQFLEAWRLSQFEPMHALLSFASREATPLDNFQALYQSIHTEMTLQGIDYRANGSGRDANNRVVVFNYDVTFDTRLLGRFTDANREMRLVFDDTVNDWRVAWSQGDLFREMGSGGQLRLETTTVNRGNIYDRNGIVLADMENTIIGVNVIRQEIPDLETCTNTLIDAMPTLAPEVIRARLTVGNADWRIEVGTIEAGAFTTWQTRLETDCNIRFSINDSRKTRRYRNGSLLPHVIGTVGYLDGPDLEAALAAGFQQDSILGRTGIERSWDETLRGQPGARLSLVTPSGTVLRTIAQNSPQVAEGVWLTIDGGLQQMILNTFAQVYADNREGWATTSKGASAVVMNVQTGEILALVSWPTYDINAFTVFPAIGREAADQILEQVQTDPRLPQLNRVTQGRYPSGSVMKIATSAAVADSEIMSPDLRFSCGGSWTRDGITRFDWLPSGHGTLTLQGAVTQSCNPYYYEAGYQMNLRDPFLFPNYLRQMGFGSVTGINLFIPEDPGYIGDPDLMRQKQGIWTFADAAAMAIGQGEVEITPMQMTRLTAAMANGGDLIAPQLILQTGLFDQYNYLFSPQVNGQIGIDPAVITVIRDGMCDVTTQPWGTAEFVFTDSELQRIGVCGKTGTAQDLATGLPPHAWFTAYAPRENPEIAITVMVENAGEGSAVAAPITRSILEYYFFGVEGVPPS